MVRQVITTLQSFCEETDTKGLGFRGTDTKGLGSRGYFHPVPRNVGRKSLL